MAILIQQLQTNVHLPVVDFTMELSHLVGFPGSATSSRTRLIAWPVTQTAGNAWAQQALSVSHAATNTTIY